MRKIFTPAFIIFAAFFLLITAPAFASTSSIRPGETVTGELGRGDDRLDDDCYYDTWVLDCPVGVLVTITETSEDIDSYLIVRTPRGNQRDNDDYSFETGLDSRITLLTSERGEYEIYATSYSPEEGDYTLTVEEIPHPNYYGIFVGIEDYGEEYDEAPQCDQDAESLYDAFIRAGLMDRGNGIVLTNSDADHRGVENAFREMSREVTPGDVFIFFFSGHGTQVEQTGRGGADELDGLDEALALVDSDLIDNELADMLDGINAQLKVVVMDACNSGGMAPDVVDGPGVICYASSEEDVLSDFAPEFRAGGYLSVFFKEAIQGDADLDNDGIIMIGELSHYLLSRYYQEIQGPEMAGDGYQELKHERGLVRQDTIFCWWGPDEHTGHEKP
jgi:hypothetical protein